MQRNAARPPAGDLALAGVHPSADPQTKLEQLIADLQRAANGARRSVEDRGDPLLAGFDLVARVSGQRLAYNAVMAVDQVVPLPAAQPDSVGAGLGHLRA